VETGLVDVTDQAGLSDWLSGLNAARPIDLLIANAGISSGPRPGVEPEGIAAARNVIGVNLLGVMNAVETVLPRMIARGSGQVAVVASLAAYRGLPDSPAYCASKAGIIAYGEALRVRAEPAGVRLSVVIPGFFTSPMSARYNGAKLFEVTQAGAVARVVAGLRRRERRIVFPLRLAFLLRCLALLPAWCGDRIITAFRFEIETG
jgi:short-subunit dehydrogenase